MAPGDITIQHQAGAAAAGGAAANRITAATSFETAGRFISALVGTGTRTFDTNGVLLATGTSSSGSADERWRLSASSGVALLKGSPVFAAIMNAVTLDEANGTGHLIAGIGVVTVAGSGMTFTESHLGFKAIKTAGAVSLYATQGDGTTENASASLQEALAGRTFDIIAVVNTTVSVDYYTRLQGGALSAATNLTSNLPTDNTAQMQFGVSNVATAYQFSWRWHAASYQR